VRAGKVVSLAALKGTRSVHPSAFAPGPKPSPRFALRRRAVRPSPINTRMLQTARRAVPTGRDA
jgi:hypothetical protein